LADAGSKASETPRSRRRGRGTSLTVKLRASRAFGLTGKAIASVPALAVDDKLQIQARAPRRASNAAPSSARLRRRPGAAPAPPPPGGRPDPPPPGALAWARPRR